MSRPALTSSKSGLSFLSCRFLIGAVCISLFLFTTACSSTKTATLTASGGNLPETQQAQHQVSIQSGDFAPQAMDIKVGDSITWVNEDTQIHTVTSWNQYQDTDNVQYSDIGTVFDSGDINPGQSFCLHLQPSRHIRLRQLTVVSIFSIPAKPCRGCRCKPMMNRGKHFNFPEHLQFYFHRYILTHSVNFEMYVHDSLW